MSSLSCPPSPLPSLSKNQKEIIKFPDPPPSIYFGGCAFGAAFYIGAFAAMRDMWGDDFHERVLMTGGSAGTIFAISIALGKSPEEINSIYRSVAEKSVRYGPVHYASLFMAEVLHEMLSDEPDAFRYLQGRLSIGTTEFFAKHRWHVAWESNEDLIYCAQSSCHIPFYCVSNRGYLNHIIVDGAYGFAGADLPHGNQTLYVGIDPNAEVTHPLTNEQMFYPNTGEEFDKLVQLGYEKMMNWDGTFRQKVENRIPNYSALCFLWPIKFLEILTQFIQDIFLYIGIILFRIIFKLISIVQGFLFKFEPADTKKD